MINKQISYAVTLNELKLEFPPLNLFHKQKLYSQEMHFLKDLKQMLLPSFDGMSI